MMKMIMMRKTITITITFHQLPVSLPKDLPQDKVPKPTTTSQGCQDVAPVDDIDSNDDDEDDNDDQENDDNNDDDNGDDESNHKKTSLPSCLHDTLLRHHVPEKKSSSTGFNGSFKSLSPTPSSSKPDNGRIRSQFFSDRLQSN